MSRGLKCPHCQKPVNFWQQMKDWDESYGADIESSDPEKAWAWLSIWCKNCDQYAYTVDLAGSFTEDMKAPENMKKDLPGVKTIAFPRKKKPKN